MRMDASKRLEDARKATRAGRYEEALAEFLWYHEHALESQPSQYGVRLSFALAYWLELAAVYPKAGEALREVRDRKTQQLRMGAGDYHLFHDVVSINEYLKETEATYALFQGLLASQPDLAMKCSRLALPAIVGEKDYALARQFLAPDLVEAVHKSSEALNDDIDRVDPTAKHKDAQKDAFTRNYIKRIKLILSILTGTGEYDEAERVREAANQRVKSSPVRELVRSAII